MKKELIKKGQESLDRWQKKYRDIDPLRSAYQTKVLDWVVKSMTFEQEPVKISRLKELLSKERASLVR